MAMCPRSKACATTMAISSCTGRFSNPDIWAKVPLGPKKSGIGNGHTPRPTKKVVTASTERRDLPAHCRLTDDGLADQAMIALDYPRLWPTVSVSQPGCESLRLPRPQLTV